MKDNKNLKSKSQTWQYQGIAGVIAAVACYSMMLVAIDTGSMAAYAATFVAFYYALHFIKTSVKLVFSNDKTTRTRAAKKAH